MQPLASAPVQEPGLKVSPPASSSVPSSPPGATWGFTSLLREARRTGMVSEGPQHARPWTGHFHANCTMSLGAQADRLGDVT